MSEVSESSARIDSLADLIAGMRRARWSGPEHVYHRLYAELVELSKTGTPAERVAAACVLQPWDLSEWPDKEFPGVEPDAAPPALARALCRTHRLDLEVGKRLGQVTHGILDRRIRLGVYQGRLRQAPSQTAGRSGWRWADLREEDGRRLPLAASARKIARLLDLGGRQQREDAVR